MKPLILLIIIINFKLLSQNNSNVCGTRTPKVPLRIPKNSMKAFRENVAQFNTPLCIKLYFTIFADNDGSNRATADTTLLRQVQNTVNQFSTHSICFLVGGIRQINNSDHNIQDAATEESELDEYMIPNYLNVFVHKILTLDTSKLNGISYDVPANRISLVGHVISQPQNGNISTMAHELGHAMGLYHTFETAYGAENVARAGTCKDCEDDGDLLCSTSADPNEEAKINANCVYTGVKVDECNSVYFPDVANIMAYGNRRCRNNFTWEQGERMRYILLNNFLITTLWKYIADENFIEIYSNTISSGNYEGITRDFYQILPIGGFYYVNGNANLTVISRKIQINNNVRFSPTTGGRILLKSNTYCN